MRHRPSHFTPSWSISRRKKIRTGSNGRQALRRMEACARIVRSAAFVISRGVLGVRRPSFDSRRRLRRRKLGTFLDTTVNPVTKTQADQRTGLLLRDRTVVEREGVSLQGEGYQRRIDLASHLAHSSSSQSVPEPSPAHSAGLEPRPPTTPPGSSGTPRAPGR